MTPEQPKVPTLRATAERAVSDLQGCGDDEHDVTAKVLRAALASDAEERAEIVAFVRDVATNYGHDEDAHRYGTICRACDASALLAKLEGKVTT